MMCFPFVLPMQFGKLQRLLKRFAVFKNISFVGEGICCTCRAVRIAHVNRMPRDRLPRIMKHYSATGRRNRGRPLKRLLDT